LNLWLRALRNYLMKAVRAYNDGKSVSFKKAPSSLATGAARSFYHVNWGEQASLPNGFRCALCAASQGEALRAIYSAESSLFWLCAALRNNARPSMKNGC
jgi:hypothetical protein